MFKIIRCAVEIPLDSLVSRAQGGKTYRIRQQLRIFGETGGPKEIRAQGTARFLIAENGDATAVSGDAELVWHVEDRVLRQYLDGEE